MRRTDDRVLEGSFSLRPHQRLCRRKHRPQPQAQAQSSLLVWLGQPAGVPQG